MPESLLEIHAREKSGQGPEWAVYRWEHLPESKGSLLTGAVTQAVYKSGKFKGRPNWKKRDPATERRVFISNVEQDAYAAKWEAETGKCSRCMGEARTLASWSKTEGTTYRPCRECGGSGKAKGQRETAGSVSA